MTSIFHSQNLDKDFVNFQKALLKTNKFKFTISDQVKPHLKKYHRLTYIIALFEDKLEAISKEPNKFLFVNEILSDLLANSSISFLGFYYSSQILIRRLIENFYNHIYFYEHPVEFEFLNLGKNDYSPILELKNYYELHPVIRKLKDTNIKTFNDQLFQHYQELCKVIHTKGESFMGLAKNIQEIKPEFNLLKHFELANKSILLIIYMLYKFHLDIAFSNTELNIISLSFPKPLRNSLLL